MDLCMHVCLPHIYDATPTGFRQVEIRLDYEPDRPNLTDAADADDDAATSASPPPIPPTPATAAEQPKTVLDINQKVPVYRCSSPINKTN